MNYVFDMLINFCNNANKMDILLLFNKCNILQKMLILLLLWIHNVLYIKTLRHSVDIIFC